MSETTGGRRSRYPQRFGLPLESRIDCVLTAFIRTRASNRLLHGARSAACRCCRAGADRHPSRSRPDRRAGRRPPSGSRRSCRSGGSPPSEYVEEFGSAASGHLLRLGSTASARTACQYSGGISSAGPTGRVAQACQSTAAAANFSICLGVGMRQLAGRLVIPN